MQLTFSHLNKQELFFIAGVTEFFMNVLDAVCFPFPPLSYTGSPRGETGAKNHNISNLSSEAEPLGMISLYSVS